MPAHRKLRPIQHVMEQQSLELLRQVLPREWVIHEYKPDYGIDLVVEIFQRVDDSTAETLGELFFVQVKSIQQTHIDKLQVYARSNVAKGKPVENQAESLTIDVIRFKIETNELLTIHSMGAAIPVMLLLVALDLHRVFFICLNDLIDKVIFPSDPLWTEKDTKTIYIPLANEIPGEPVGLDALRFYARRPKHYAAFQIFHYQSEEIKYAASNLSYHLDLHDSAISNKEIIEVIDLLRHFVNVIKNLDIWYGLEVWQPLVDAYDAVQELEHLLNSGAKESLKAIKYAQRRVWHQLALLPNSYEELCREWFLPTYLAQRLSYPEPSEY